MFWYFRRLIFTPSSFLRSRFERMLWGYWGKPTIPASAQLAAPHAVSILIIAPWSEQWLATRISTTRRLQYAHVTIKRVEQLATSQSMHRWNEVDWSVYDEKIISDQHHSSIAAGFIVAWDLLSCPVPYDQYSGLAGFDSNESAWSTARNGFKPYSSVSRSSWAGCRTYRLYRAVYARQSRV